MRFRWLALIALFPLAGCGVIYKVDTQQGNLFDKATVESLQPGMSKRQVLLVMGSPAVISPFNQDRWDYVSTIRRGRNSMETKDLTLYFENDLLARIDGDYFPEDPDQMIKDARKYKRQYTDEKSAAEERKKRRRGGDDQGQG
jgi:outer membrane protein assembly factor BamE